MARARNIKPALFSNDLLAEVDPLGRILFIGLWTICDYKGNLEFRAKKIKAALLPYDNCDVTELSINLEQSGFIQSYSNDGVIYISVVNFSKHQNPHKNERDKGTDTPSISDNGSQLFDLNKGQIKSDKIEINPDNNGTNRADSLILNPDPLILNPDPLNQQNDLLLRRKVILEAFNYFWSNMSLSKKAKSKGESAFNQAVKKIDDPMHFAIHLVKDTNTRFDNQQLGFDKMHPTTYLNQSRWEDDYTVDKPSGATKTPMVSNDTSWISLQGETF